MFDFPRLHAFYHKSSAFLARDFLNETSYKPAFLLQLAGVFTSSLTFFFLSRLMEPADIPALAPYGGNYFAFIIIGQAFIGYLEVSVRGLAKTIRDGQMLGTLEALLLTRTSIPMILLGSSLYNLAWTSFTVLLYLLSGVFLFDLDISAANLPGVLAMLVLTLSAFSGLGILSAAFIIVFKRGDPVSWVFLSLSRLFGGLYFPVSIMPESLQMLANLLPITYALEGMRMALLQGWTPWELGSYLTALGLFTLFLLPLSLYIFQAALRTAKQDGSLSQY